MVPDEEGFEYPQTDTSACENCGMCENLCAAPDRLACGDSTREGAAPGEAASGSAAPGDAASEGAAVHKTCAYAAKAKSDTVRMASSSGGISALLARQIIAEGGVVYGAAVGANALIEHVRVTDEAGLSGLRGSKYVQSSMGSVLQMVAKDLAANRPVLFTGTPCQTGGLKNYLRKKRQSDSSLIYQDIVCHGVPPYKAWRKYLDDSGYHGDVSVSFRDKSSGWRDFSLRLAQPGRVYQRKAGRDPFYMAYISGIMLRRSCYECRYRNMRCSSDITLADFWNNHEVLPRFADDAGVSLVFVHTGKGEDALQSISAEILLAGVSVEDGIRSNRQAIIEGPVPHPKRDVFLTQIEAKNFRRLAVRYVKGGILRWGMSYLAKNVKNAAGRLSIRQRPLLRKLRFLCKYFLRDHHDAISRLKSCGITNVRAFHIRQWVRYIDKNIIRYYYKAKLSGNACFVKISGDSTIENEINVNKYLSRCGVDFAPRYLYSGSDFCEGASALVVSYVPGLRSFCLPDDAVLFESLCAEFESIYQRLNSLGIIHGDISSSNLMLDGNNHIVLTDFGIGKVPGAEASGVDYGVHRGTYYIESADTRTYDDAYSFIHMLDDAGIPDSFRQMECYKRIERLAGLHTYSVDIRRPVIEQ